MSVNRRNHYRTLHVQPDAPPEVIRAAYRALIALHHPDAGGDDERAASINAAYAILSDTARRAAYDAVRTFRYTRAAHDEEVSVGSSTPRPPRTDRCALCHLAHAPVQSGKATRCARCRAPLAAVVRGSAPGHSVERRARGRVSKSEWAVMHAGWPSEPVDVRMRDLSLDGISVFVGGAVPVGQVIRVTSAAFDVVADVVSCRPIDRVFTLHARLVNAIFTRDVGGFVSTTA